MAEGVAMEVQQQEDVLPQNNFKTPFVEKSVPLDFDDGCMLAFDTANVLEVKHSDDREEFLKKLSRDNAQLLINRLWQLPTERVDTVIVATLPARTTVLPREKPVPKAKPLTKWQEYRKSKGIQNRKKDKMVWDETAKEFRPRWGYKRANDSANNWAVELPPNADLSEDPFEKQQNQKKERVAKNELQRLRNIARAEKLQVPYQPQQSQQQSTDNLTKVFHQVTKSTASLGKFVDKVRNEPQDKRSGKKQHFESNLVDAKTERDRQMRILDEITAQRPILNVEKAANRQIATENREKRNAGKVDKKSGKKHRRNWLPPEKYARAQKREAERDAKKGGGKTKTPRKEGKIGPGKKFPGGKGLAKAKSGGGKAASKTRSMLKRSK